MSSVTRKRRRQIERYRTKIMQLFLLFGPPKKSYDSEDVIKYHDCVHRINWRGFRAPLMATYNAEFEKLRRNIGAPDGHG